ncbi:cell surface receptor IPT/TIG domain protein [Leadbetterella byssophila DSM 17132]|uniref:Cell surface receptor IPT/TIG domain protein n=1 Tax=Leadbetterella byssophila (strain DSM 17132 / JCM 16389 / KACC 11308 / NBRC 106382 / 4M15) TaxID=649349 RepID=E4RXX8_LEAB4|nr:IPT/TIG domain-containing protein [Leadbetterella byssophila]ADQ19075.1 cell surface receptor IPT/TIG domain protein [Leadbetterella byssophila DSM 17132]
MKRYSLLFLFAALALTWSCTEDTDGTPGIKPGNLSISSVFPDSASGGELVVVKGSGLGDIRSVVLEKGEVPAGFQPTLNTEGVFMFRVPLEAQGGTQKVTLTNGNGVSQSFDLRVLAFPVIYDVSNYNFSAGSEITITGLNLEDVHTVRFAGTNESIDIVSKTKTSLTIKFKSTNVERSALDIINATGPIKTTQEFVNLDKAFVIFTDAYGEGFGDGSWGDPGTITDAEAKTGSKSIYKNYQKGNWHLINFANWWPGVEENKDWKYLTVWIKGASQDYTLYLTGDMRAGGFGNGDRSYPLNVPAGKWTYFKIPLSEVKLWEKGTPFFQLGFWIPGPDAQDEIFHFDDLIFVK